jgi:endonuclease/exonuclease/phosphatase family metal-dependent hydrolase
MRPRSIVCALLACALAFASASLARPGAARASVTAASPGGRTGAVTTFATYNVCNLHCAPGGHRWSERKPAVVRTIAASGADVLALQEADRGKGMFLQVAALIRPSGYAIASTDVSNCDGVCGDHVFYKMSTIEPWFADTGQGTITAGLQPLAAQTSGSWGSVRHRSFSWALLRVKSTGARFLAISTHLPVEKTAAGEAARQAAASGMAVFVTRLLAQIGMPKLPTVLMGDLNSFPRRQPHGAQYRLEQAGYTDTFDAKRRFNDHYSSINTNPKIRHLDGWPLKPFRNYRLGSHIDYIMAKNVGRAISWGVALWLRRGKFDRRFHGSDHNMVRAQLIIPST